MTIETIGISCCLSTTKSKSSKLFVWTVSGCFHVPRCLHMCVKMLKELLQEEPLTNGLSNGTYIP